MKNTVLAILLTICSLLLATALGLGIIHLTGFPYNVDIEQLEIVEKTGYSESEIMDNYDAVMHYLVPFTDCEFILPTMAYSKEGASHFYDTKLIFNAIYILGAVSLILILFMAYNKWLGTQVLRLSGILTIAVPCVLGALFYINFDRVFIVFHQIFFSNDNWIFDPYEDEIINILPQDFFMHCAIFIVLFWVIASILQLMFSRISKNTID